MAKTQNSGQKTAARIVKDVFIKHGALSPETAIPISTFKNVKLTTAVISYTIANFMEEEIVYKAGDDRYYFHEENWKKLEKKVSRGYWILVATPVICLFLVLIIRHWKDIAAVFS